MTLRWSSISLSIVLLLASGTAVFADKKCYCRTATGEHIEVGKVACLKTNTGMQEALCGMVLNNTAWKFTGRACPVASLGGKQRKPATMAINFAY